MSGTPYYIGHSGFTGVAAGSEYTVGTITLTQGDTAFVCLALPTSGSTITAVTDDAGNPYTQIASVTTETLAQSVIYACYGLNPMTAGNVYITQGGTTPLQVGVLIIGDTNVSGTDSIGPFSNAGASGSISASWTTLSQAEEHLVAIVVNNAPAGTPSTPSGWTAISTDEVDSDTGSYAFYKDVTATTSGSFASTMTSGDWSIVLIPDLVSAVTPALVLSNGVEGDPYSQTLTASGGTGSYTWALTSGSLPAGLTLVSGVVSGTPTASGTFTVTLTATDGSGMTGAATSTFEIMSNTVTEAPAMKLPNNRFSAIQSDFETGAGGGWSVSTGATGNSGFCWVNDNASLTGDYSTYWEATASENIVQSASAVAFRATAGQPVVVSCGVLLAQGANAQAQLQIVWQNSAQTTVATSTAPAVTPNGYQWAPLQGAFTCPSGASQFVVQVVVNGSNPGDINRMDTCWLGYSDVQVLIDPINNTFATPALAGQGFADVTWAVDQEATVINITHGRQDSVNEMQSASSTFTLENNSGPFTQAPASPTLITALGGTMDLGRRLQINITDQNGVWNTRFDGVIGNLAYDNSDDSGNTATVAVTGADVLAFLNRQPDMLPWTQATVLANGPEYHWALTDAGTTGGGGSFSETSGNNHRAMRAVSSDSTGTATITYASTNAGVETLADAALAGANDGSEYWSPGSDQPSQLARGLDSGGVGPYISPVPSPELVPDLTATTAAGYFTSNKGWYAIGQLDNGGYAASGSWAAEIYFMCDPAIQTAQAANSKYGPYVPFALGSTRTQNCIIAGIYLTGSGGASFEMNSYANTPGFAVKNFNVAPAAALASTSATWAGDKASVPHHLVINVSGGSATLHLDGVNIGSIVLPANAIYDTVTAGAAPDGTGCFYGNVSLLQVYPFELTEAQIQMDCAMGQYGMFEQTTDNCVAQLGQMAGIPEFWNGLQQNGLGLSLTDYYDISQDNPVTSMQIFEQMERGLLFTNAAGIVNFHTRDWRMGYNGPDQYLPPDTFDGDMGLQVTDQFMQNAATVTSTAFTSGGSYQNTASVDQYGDYFSDYTSAEAAAGTVNTSIILPLYAWNRAGASFASTFTFLADPNFTDWASWTSYSLGNPWLTPGTCTIDMLTLDQAGTGVTIADLYALEIDMMIAPDGTLPSSFPQEAHMTEWFIEGISETYGLQQRTIQFYTSQAFNQRAWVPGDPNYGVLGTTSRIGLSMPDVSVVEADGKDVAHDAGRPYWPPNFTALAGNFAIDGNFASGGLTNWNTYQCTTSWLHQPATACPQQYAVSVAYISSESGFFYAVQSVAPQQEYTIGVWAYSAAGATFQFEVQEWGTGNTVYEDGLLSSTFTVPAGGQWTYYQTQITGTYAGPDVTWKWGVTVLSGTIEFTDFEIAPGQAGLNNPSANGHDFIGNLETRGIADSLSIKLSPPMLCVGQISNTQSLATGAQTSPGVLWDTIFVDTENGMGLIPGYPNWYCVTRPGFYDIDFCGIMAPSSATAGVAAYIVVAEAAAQNQASGAGNPALNGAYVFPTGEINPFNGNSYVVPVTGGTRMYLGLGDAVALWMQHDAGSSVLTANNDGGSHMSLVWRGYGRADDRAEINTLVGTGGVVSAHPYTIYHTSVFTNTHTYSYQGYYSYSSGSDYARIDSDGVCYQGLDYKAGASATSQVVFNVSAMRLAIANAGGVVTGATLSGYLSGGYQKPGVVGQASYAWALLGTTTIAPGAKTYNPSTGATTRTLAQMYFKAGKVTTAAIPVSIVNKLLATDTCIILGDGNAKTPGRSGEWHGGPNSWKLTIHWKVVS